jgi:hypothetical protein
MLPASALHGIDARSTLHGRDRGGTAMEDGGIGRIVEDRGS